MVSPMHLLPVYAAVNSGLCIDDHEASPEASEPSIQAHNPQKSSKTSQQLSVTKKQIDKTDPENV